MRGADEVARWVAGRVTDLSATLLLSDPEQYDGGERVVQDTYGEHLVKREMHAGCAAARPADRRSRTTS
ncbi:hypothetical protein CAL27_13195 [Bordetella genomosp. 1]|uniref:Uncharacterized protein n=1 Tax=Bordetella genomosp. 1 TaxID=1395607 RepID=A0ABX4F1R0_9BORD|nr:hypothetical protein CAL27_13195 [Bordetella genomosp. 1]